MAAGNIGKTYNDVASPKNKTVDPELDRAFTRGLPIMLTPESEAELDRHLGIVPDCSLATPADVEFDEEDDFDDDTIPVGVDAALYALGD